MPCSKFDYLHMRMKLLSRYCIPALLSGLSMTVIGQNVLKEGEMPVLPAFPEIPEKMPVGSVKLGDSETFDQKD